MRYIFILFLAACLPISASQTDAPMSPAVKAHLCKLAKRDATITPEQIDAHKKARAACLADLYPEEPAGVDTGCTPERGWGDNTSRPKITIRCSKRYQDTRQDCPAPTYTLHRRLGSAPDRMVKYCTDE